ncbi:SE1561 family protein [Planococcus sp. FY231025]|uniref:SE1561 family protein n=1 Tax=Planococcus sp. FY231025 TaxID=3455699 RepID=UPI003F9265BC
MGKSITNKEQQVDYMKQRLNIFLEVLDAIEPENTDLEDIDRLIAMVDDLENKMQQFKSRPSDEN